LNSFLPEEESPFACKCYRA